MLGTNRICHACGDAFYDVGPGRCEPNHKPYCKECLIEKLTGKISKRPFNRVPAAHTGLTPRQRHKLQSNS